MTINKGELFAAEDVYIDYPYEKVMYRWDHIARLCFVRFYGKDERPTPIATDNKLFNDAILFGDRITKAQYEQGKVRL